MEIYKDENAPVGERVSDLISRMTIEEKVGQLMQLPAKQEVLEDNFVDKLEEWYVGSYLHCTGNQIRELQERALGTRLGIPLLFGIDAIHGHCFEDRGTVFPSQLAVSCSWNREIIKEMARVTAKEVRACGIHWTFSPVLCVARDPRWGRVNETFGESPWLIGELALAMVEGYQGDDFCSMDSIMACAKHYAGYGESTGGRDSYESEISKRKMLSLFLPPFEKVVKKGKVASLMAGYQAIDGVPASANRWLLREVPRGAWGFDGIIVTDWDNTGSLVSKQSVAKDDREAAALAITSGNDMIMSTAGFYHSAVNLVREGAIDEALVDESVKRILELKFKLGLFDKMKHVDGSDKDKTLGLASHWESALEASRESITLLSNNGVLPLTNMKGKRVLLAGPNADDVIAQLGDWSFGSMQAGASDESFHRDDSVTLLQALREATGQYEFDFDYIAAVDVIDETIDETGKAAKLAENADVIIACVGDTLAQYGEGHDRSNLDLTGKQQKLLEALKDSGKPLVVVFMASKPLVIPWIKDNADALVCCFNPGARGGIALKEVLFGEYNPLGKLTVSFPYNTGQLPVYHNQYAGWHCFNGDQLERYLDLPAKPVFSFGQGINYSTFNYSALKVLTPVVTDGQNPRFEITITNDSERPGTEIVQMYFRDLVSSVTTPMKNLCGYRRVDLAAGESRTVAMEIELDDLALVTPELERVVEPGEFIVMIGASSLPEDCLSAVFTVE